MVFYFSSRRRHTICAVVTGVQTCALPILRRGPEALAFLSIGQRIADAGLFDRRRRAICGVATGGSEPSQLGKQQRQGKRRAGDRDIERHVAGETREGERLEPGVGKQAKDRDCEAYAQPIPSLHGSLRKVASPDSFRSNRFGARPAPSAMTIRATN